MINIDFTNLKNLLDVKHKQYNTIGFITSDPIQIPHLFKNHYDIEIAAFLIATIAWGQRKTIIHNGKLLMSMMDMAPYDFIMNAKEKDYKPFFSFKHRTFNGEDCVFFLQSLRNIYRNHGGLHRIFYEGYFKNDSIVDALINFRNIFFEPIHLHRTKKHVSDVSKNSSAKRLNMFLRWMVRNDKSKVDFGIWNKISTKHLFIPLDVHTGNIARKLNLLKRKQNDWQAVEELTNTLREFDPEDPVKYDYALFGMGVYEKS